MPHPRRNGTADAAIFVLPCADSRQIHRRQASAHAPLHRNFTPLALDFGSDFTPNLILPTRKFNSSPSAGHRIRPAIRRDSVPKRPTWLSPTLSGGANFDAPSEWLNYSRAYRRGDDKFHPSCCQMKHLRRVYPQRMFLVSAWHCLHPHPSGAPPFPAPQGARIWSHPDGASRLVNHSLQIS